MPEKKTSYADLVVQVVREASEPLPFTEIMERVNMLSAITTRNPKGTIRNAVNNSLLVVSTGDGRYGWKYRIINGAVIRLPLSETNLAQRRVIYSDELRDALWPAFFENKKHGDRAPVHLNLPGGKTAEWPIVFFGNGNWGTGGSPEFWDWLETANARPGDELIIRVVDGEGRLYAIEFHPLSERDEEAIAQRNQQILHTIAQYNQKSHEVRAIWEVSSRLLCTGQYHHPIPPDPLEILLKDQLQAPALLEILGDGKWMLANEPDIPPLLAASLLEQIVGSLGRQRSKKKAVQPLSSSNIYQLKVTLKKIHPPIWRRIQVPGGLTLPQLHAVLQIVMGWTNSHLHGFQVGKLFYTEPDPDEDGEDDEGTVMDERPIRLSQIAPQVGAQFIYEYDFGDNWEHNVVVEQILLPAPGTAYPRCIDGQRACPPEDVGGPGGYAEFLAALHNPDHPEHATWLEWAGKQNNPKVFDLPGTNELLQLVYPHLLENG